MVKVYVLLHYERRRHYLRGAGVGAKGAGHHAGKVYAVNVAGHAEVMDWTEKSVFKLVKV